MTNHFLPNGDKEIWTWKERMEAASTIVSGLPYTEVHDFGCGLGKIRDLIHGRKYIGYDGKLWTTDIILCDFNERFPEIRGEYNWRMALCLGLLEYVEDVDGFIRNLSKSFPCVVLSYSKRDDQVSELFKGVRFLWLYELEEILAKHFGGFELSGKVGVHYIYTARKG